MANASISQFDKGSLDKLDYEWDWSRWLTGSEKITSASFILPTGINLETNGHSDTTATAWLSGGNLGSNYLVGCLIETDEGRKANRNILIRIVQR